MYKYFLAQSLRQIAIVACSLSLLWGCSGEPESTPKPMVISKKIQLNADAPPKAAPNSAVMPAGSESTARPTDRSGITGAESATAGLAPKTTADGSPAPAIGPAIEMVAAYNPEGKLDPFVPLFKDEPAAPQKVGERQRRRIPQTPLERVDLSQLKLAGVIRAPKGSRALVEEASGKGYIVARGTYMGINSGKVTEILKDRIIVEEEVEDVLGKIMPQKRELKLQKPAGED